RARLCARRPPPGVASEQVVLVPMLRKEDRAAVLQAATAVADELRAAGVRVRVDDRPDYRPGFKFNEWELKGVPLRLEIGGRDLAAGGVTGVGRGPAEKEQNPVDRVGGAVDPLLGDPPASPFLAAPPERGAGNLPPPHP